MALTVVASHILIVDQLIMKGWLADHYENVQLLNLYVVGWSSAILAACIGGLLLKQLVSLSKNLTTIETYVEGIELVVPHPTNPETVEASYTIREHTIGVR